MTMARKSAIRSYLGINNVQNILFVESVAQIKSKMMFYLCGVCIAVFAMAVPARVLAGAPACANSSVDLSKIGHIAPKGRVQDKEYNPHLPVVDALIEAGTDAIPFLVSKLEDETEVEGHVMDYWPSLRVGDVALVILTDFFTRPDWKHSTIPGFTLDEILERRTEDIAAWAVLDEYIKKHGRDGLRRKVEKLLEPYDWQLAWDAQQQCYVPAKDKIQQTNSDL
jgi:hypothetical protein